MSGISLQGAFTSGELAPSLMARVDLSKYQQGCRTLKNFLVQPHGGAVKRPGFLLLDDLPGAAVLVPFVFNESQTYCLVFGEKWMRVAQRGGLVFSNGKPYQIETPYTLAQAKTLSYVQSADVLFIACQGRSPHRLKRFDHARWEFEAISFAAPIKPPGRPTAKFHNEAKKSDGSSSDAQLVTPYTYYVTSVDADGRESELSKGRKITGPSSSNWQAGDYLTVTWQGPETAKEFRIYKAEFGGRPGYLATVGASAGEGEYKDYNNAPAMTEGAPEYTNPFPNGDYPTAVGLFEQRLVFASSPNRPQTIWMSKSGDYSNFATYTPIADDSPIELTLASPEVSPMCWMVSLRSLILGSTSMEWELASTQGAFTSKTAKATPQSYRGSTRLPALIIGNVLLHVSRSGSQVRDLQYDFGADSYGGTDRTILAAHLLENAKIVSWTYQQAPDSVVWAVRSDGVLLGLTFQPEHEVYAWHRHESDGQFKSVCSVPDGHEDTLFAVVQRGGRYLLERMSDRYLGGDYSRAVFLDSALILESNEAKTSFSGLEHLEGKTVQALADGAVSAPVQVSGGRITLPKAARLVIIGLPYTADLESMPLETAGENGVSVGRKKYVNAVNVLFRDTVTARVGVNFDRADNVKWRLNEKWGEPLRPFSGIKRVVTRSMAENTVTVCVRSEEPTPMTVLALMPSVEVK